MSFSFIRKSRPILSAGSLPAVISAKTLRGVTPSISATSVVVSNFIHDTIPRTQLFVKQYG